MNMQWGQEMWRKWWHQLKSAYASNGLCWPQTHFTLFKKIALWLHINMNKKKKKKKKETCALHSDILVVTSLAVVELADAKLLWITFLFFNFYFALTNKVDWQSWGMLEEGRQKEVCNCCKEGRIVWVKKTGDFFHSHPFRGNSQSESHYTYI